MADVILFHHVLGPTAGVHAFADRLRAGGHTVEVPDLFDGARFDSIEAGIAHVESVGFGTVIEHGVAVAEGRAPGFYVAGFSLGVLPALALAVNDPSVAGAICYHSAVPATEFGDGWRPGVRLQLHLNDRDPWNDPDELDNARALAVEANGELFVYESEAHLVADSSTADYDAGLAALIIERTLAFLT